MIIRTQALNLGVKLENGNFREIVIEIPAGKRITPWSLTCNNQYINFGRDQCFEIIQKAAGRSHFSVFQ